MAELYIDSANIKEIQTWGELGIFAGVTTTPTFFFRQGILDYRLELKKINKIFPGQLQIEAMGSTAEEIVENARKNHTIGTDIVSKIPICQHAVKAVQLLKKKGIKTNIHLVFSVNQAILAARAGADYICPLLGRMTDIGGRAFDMLEEIVLVIKKYGFSCKIMASSIRSPEDVKKSMLLGIDIVTIPPKIIAMMFNHPLTTLGINSFQQDISLSARISEIMRYGDQLPVLQQESSLFDALVVMSEKKLGIAIITGPDGQVAGIITDGDLRRCLKAKKEPASLSVREIMTDNPVTIRDNISARDALVLMEKRKITELIVVNEAGRLCGCLNIHDILSKEVTLG